MRYILDTDWIINLLAGRQDAKVKIEQLDPEEIGISLVTVAEIYESAFNYLITQFPQLISAGRAVQFSLSDTV
jgi:predicted nucleic acid-binding protein